jgi:transcriptional regulator with GAF, ATPase, and Fis domain
MAAELTETRSLHASIPRDLSVRRLLVAHAPERPDIGASMLLDAATTIGRKGGGAQFELGDTAVSRLHLRVEPVGSAWRAVDMGSRNGSFVDGIRIVEAELPGQSVLRVGDTVLLYQELTIGRAEALDAEAAPLFGPSLAMERVRAQTRLLAPERIPVLVLGESGVGKELVAAELHRRSGRRGSFVPVNCGALPRDLVESELFGHVEGAFTGAGKSRPGLFAAADGGTLFLDEIGELPTELQPKLLRALATGEVRPVGSASPKQVDVRLVAATHRDLQAAVERGTFRGDLFARLSGYTLRVPPLRERKEDVLALARRLSAPEPEFSANAAEALLLHPWPWNVRELEQAVAAALVRGRGERIELLDLPDGLHAPIRTRSGAPPAPESPVLPLSLRVRRDGTPDRDSLIAALKACGGNVSRVAEFFGKERAQVYRWMRRYDIADGAYRG